MNIMTIVQGLVTILLASLIAWLFSFPTWVGWTAGSLGLLGVGFVLGGMAILQQRHGAQSMNVVVNSMPWSKQSLLRRRYDRKGELAISRETGEAYCGKCMDEKQKEYPMHKKHSKYGNFYCCSDCSNSVDANGEHHFEIYDLGDPPWGDGWLREEELCSLRDLENPDLWHEIW